MKWLSGDQNQENEAVKLSQLKLQFGVFGTKFLSAPDDKVSIQITATSTTNKLPKPSSSSISLIPFHHRTQKGRCCTQHTTSPRRFLSSKSPSVTWDARDLKLIHRVTSLASLDIAFHVLYGEGNLGESSAKMAVVGKVSTSVAVAELLAKEEEMMKTRSNSCLEKKLPIKLKVNGLCIEATLSVSMRVLKVMRNEKNSKEELGRRPFENQVESKKKRGILWRVKHLTSLTKVKNGKLDDESEQQPSPYESDGGSPLFDSDDSTTSSGSGSSSSSTTGSSRLHNGSSEIRARLETVNRRSWSQLSPNGSFKGWGGFITSTTKQDGSLITHSAPSTKSHGHSLQSHLQDNNNFSPTARWRTKEILSRDGQAKLKTSVFFASFDQRSEQASGHSACTVLVALIAHWLHSNKNTMPTRSQFDALIMQGSKEWRKLCNTDRYLNLFPDKHFDLETIIEANLRPLIVMPQESYTGFFSPEKFRCLKGAMSFDEIWDEINKKVAADCQPRIYIVSWNDHFFVLKVEVDTCYVIDSLGERLFEGCKQGFMLRFDESSLMYGKGDKGSLEVVCSGKECCKEFIKRCLAAIPLWQLEKEEKKGNVSSLWIHRQLQIEFHYSISLP